MFCPYVGLLLKAVHTLLNDDGFKLPTQPAIRTTEISKKLVAWMSKPENDALLSTFTLKLTASLEKCFQVRGSSFKTKKEKIWGEYHKKRTSEGFRTDWTQFLLQAVGEEPYPLFYQFITDHVFNVLIRQHFPVLVADETATSSTQESLTYAETNALRYAAGYVCRSVKKHLMGSSHPLKEELVLALVDMCGEDKETDHRDASTDWITSIDRGGLCHIKDTGYRVFHVMEEELRNHLRISNVRNLSDCCRDKLVSCLVQSERVASYIRMANLDLEPEEEVVLVRLLVEHWIRIRGFSFTGAYMELYKQKSKKNLQRSKALRTRLAPSSTKS